MLHGIYWVILALGWGVLGLFWAVGWVYNLWKAPAVQRRTTFLPAWILGIVFFVWLATMLLRHNFLEFITHNALATDRRCCLAHRRHCLHTLGTLGAGHHVGRSSRD